MINIFDDKIAQKHHHVVIKYGLIIGLMFVFWLISSSLFIIFRLDIGRFVAMLLGITVSSIYGIMVYGFIVFKIIPIRQLNEVVDMLSKKENRILECTFVNAAPGAITYLGLTFTILHIRPLDKENSSIIEVYFYDGTNIKRPEINKPLRLALSEQVIMGYEPI